MNRHSERDGVKSLADDFHHPAKGAHNTCHPFRGMARLCSQRRWENSPIQQWGTAGQWWGTGLMVLGVVTIFNFWSPVPIPLVGLPAILAGAFMIGAGMLLRQGRGAKRDTNKALEVALKYGNRLTVPRLALELDISIEKAEKIIEKLVKKGIAEINLDSDQSDEGIVYRVKGI